MALHEVHRFHDPAAASAVLAIAETMTNVRMEVDRSPSTDHGIGQYVIRTLNGLDIWGMNKMHACVGMALTIALADELRKRDRHNPLCNIWHLLPENRSRLARYDLSPKEL